MEQFKSRKSVPFELRWRTEDLDVEPYSVNSQINVQFYIVADHCLASASDSGKCNKIHYIYLAIINHFVYIKSETIIVNVFVCNT